MIRSGFSSELNSDGKIAVALPEGYLYKPHMEHRAQITFTTLQQLQKKALNLPNNQQQP